MNEIIALIQDYGIDTILIALLITILTGIIKIPLKKLAKKTDDSHKWTKYITLLPII